MDLIELPLHAWRLKVTEKTQTSYYYCHFVQRRIPYCYFPIHAFIYLWPALVFLSLLTGSIALPHVIFSYIGFLNRVV